MGSRGRGSLFRIGIEFCMTLTPLPALTGRGAVQLGDGCLGEAHTTASDSLSATLSVVTIYRTHCATQSSDGIVSSDRYDHCE